MKAKIIIFLWLLAGVGGKAKAEGTVGTQPITFVAEGVGHTLFIDTWPSEDAWYKKQEIGTLLGKCIKYAGEIICKISREQLEQILESDSLTSRVAASKEDTFFSLALASATRGALTGAIAVTVFSIGELLWENFCSCEDGLRVEVTENALGATHSLPQWGIGAKYTAKRLEGYGKCLINQFSVPSNFALILRTLRNITLKVGIGAFAGALAGLAFHPFDSPSVVVEIGLWRDSSKHEG